MFTDTVSYQVVPLVNLRETGKVVYRDYKVLKPNDLTDNGKRHPTLSLGATERFRSYPRTHRTTHLGTQKKEERRNWRRQTERKVKSKGLSRGKSGEGIV